MGLKWYGDKLLQRIRDETVDGLTEAAELLIKTAAAKAPKRTGDLRSSGYVASTKRSTYQKTRTNRKERPVKPGQVVAAFADFKAMWYEAGTSRQAARPFMRPALDELKNELGKVVIRKMRRKVDK